jgi:hypothetical protein
MLIASEFGENLIYSHLKHEITFYSETQLSVCSGRLVFAKIANKGSPGKIFAEVDYFN